MKMKIKFPLWILSLFCLTSAVVAQQAQMEGQPARSQKPTTIDLNSRPKPIQDNSFLIEEAYNQENGVIQHINAFLRQPNGDWLFTFTEEWPIHSQKHQLSLTIPALGFINPSETCKGIGDIALNYRYQLAGDGNSIVAIAPRISLLLPTGDEKKGHGSGATGIQINVPISIQPSRLLVTHTNVGMTYTPLAKNASGAKANLSDYNLGQSFIWLTNLNFNAMVELLWQSNESIIASKSTERNKTFTVNPGIRWAHNFRNGLQIVPGIGMPIELGSNRPKYGVFLYISFEHPLKKGTD